MLLGLISILPSVLQVKATDNSYLKLLDISKEVHVDTVSNILLGEGFNVAREDPRIFNITFEKNDVTIDVKYTPTTKHVFSYIIIADTINKTDLLDGPRQIFEILIGKYGTPDYAGEPHETQVRYGINEYDLDNIISNESQVLDTLSLRHFVKGVYSPEKFEYVWENDSVTISFRCITLTRFVNSHDESFFLYNLINKQILESYYSERKELEDHARLMDFWGKAFYLFLGLVAIAIIIVVLNKKDKKEQVRLELKLKEAEEKQTVVNEQYNQFVRELSNKYGTIDRVVSIIDYDNDLIERHNDIFVFQESKVVIINKAKYNFSDLISCSILDENQGNIPVSQVTRTKTGSMIGRAAVGVLTFGVAGAVVGAVTAKKESTNTITSTQPGLYVVKIGLKSVKNPVLTLEFGSDKNKAEEVYALMQAIIAMK